MNARGALLLATVLLLAGGAWWLSHGLGAHSRHEAANPSGAAERSSASAPETRVLESSTVGDSETRSTLNGDATAAPSRAKPATLTALTVHVARRVTIPITPNSGRSGPNESVAHARVRIVDTSHADEHSNWKLVASEETDALGLFSFDGLAGTPLMLQAEETIGGSYCVGRESITVSETSGRPLQLYVEESLRDALTITVVDRDTLQPIAGARVRTSADLDPKITNALGQFSVDGDASGGVDVSASIRATGYYPTIWNGRFGKWTPPAPERAAVQMGRAVFFDHELTPRTTNDPQPIVRLSRSARAAGRVLDTSGKSVPRAGLRVHVSFGREAYAADDVRTEADEHGDFVFDALPAGISLRLAVQVRGESTRTDPEEFVLEPGESRVLTLHVRGHVELSGRVLDAQDALVKSGKIRLQVEGESDEGSIRSDGTYYLPFAVAGRGWITVTREGEPSEGNFVDRIPIDVPTGIPEWNFDVRLIPLAVVSGHFLDDDGTPIRAGTLYLSGANSTTLECGALGEGGEFVFEIVPQGNYVLMGEESRGAKRRMRMDVRAGDRTIELRLPACGFVVGRIVDETGALVTDTYVSIDVPGSNMLAAKSGSDGVFRSAAPAGSAWIWAEGNGRASRRERVDVIAGAETKVPDLKAFSTSTVRFTAGRLLAGAHVEVHDGQGLFASGELADHGDLNLQAPIGVARVVIQCGTQEPRIQSTEVRAGESSIILVTCDR